jgi:tetratricopeptide (TPR) repeat protein
MPENNKTEEFLQKLAPCIERSDLDACVEEAARVAEELGMGASDLLDLSSRAGKQESYTIAYVLSLAAAKGLEGNAKSAAYSIVALAAGLIGMTEKAEEQYRQAIDADPKDAAAHYNYAILLQELKRNEEAEEQYRPAIDADPKHANAHGAYGLLLIELDRRKDAWKEIEMASDIFENTGYFTWSHLAIAWYYEKYSKKNFDSKKFYDSGEDADKAGDEYLKAAENAEGSLKDNLTSLGFEFKAKSFVRKIPVPSWYKKLLYKVGKSPDIPELIDNLRNAAVWYRKAASCSVDEKKEVCNACYTAITVFSESLNAMSSFINGEKADVNRDDWLNKLDFARKIYEAKNKGTGVNFVDTLKQLTECVNELAEHQVIGLKPQEQRLGKCYNNLIKVSENLDGALKLLTEHAVEAIGDYAKKQGMGFIGEEKPKRSLWDSWLTKAFLAILTVVAAIITMLQFLHIDFKALDFIKSLIWGIP